MIKQPLHIVIEARTRHCLYFRRLQYIATDTVEKCAKALSMSEEDVASDDDGVDAVVGRRGNCLGGSDVGGAER